MKIALVNHGCAKNLVDSELMLGLLTEKGHEITLDENDAQIVIVNTCSFIHDAEKESVQSILELINEGKKVIVTAGGTIEDIDPVRFISNYSSGKMGIAIADESYRQGARTVLITSKDVEKPYDVIKVKSAQDMQKAINHEFKNADYIFMAAAITDFRVKNFNNQKIKKTDTNEMTLELVKNPDILKEICGRKKSESSGSVIVGFCAETENLIDYAKKKIIEKGCDFIVANDVSRKDIGFSSDENEVFIIDKHLNIKKLEKEQKSVIAKKIIGEIYEQSGNLQLIG